MVKTVLQQFAEILLKKEEVDLPNKGSVGASNVTSILNTVFIIFGGIALVIIVIAGIKFITAQGNPDGVAKARNTIIYAAIGLAIILSAATIVNVVIGRI